MTACKETRIELSACMWRDLGELVEQGEIDQQLAQRITDDLFEPLKPGAPPILTSAAWRVVVESRQKLATISAIRRPLARIRRVLGQDNA